MKSVLVTDVPTLISVAHVERAIRLPRDPRASVAEARRLAALLAQAIAQGHEIERYAEPDGPGLPVELTEAPANLLVGALIGVRMRLRPPIV